MFAELAEVWPMSEILKGCKSMDTISLQQPGNEKADKLAKEG